MKFVLIAIIVGVPILLWPNHHFQQAIKHGLPLLMLMFISGLYIDFFRSLRPAGAWQYSNLERESVFTLKYGSYLFMLSALTEIAVAIYLAVTYKWWFIFTPFYVVFPVSLLRGILESNGILFFLVGYPICVVWWLII